MSKIFARGQLIFTSVGLVALLCIFAAAALAQTSSTGALTGTVTDSSGAVIAGATVTVTNTSTGEVRTASTDAKGSYQISLLPPGTYAVKFEASGFETSEVPSVTVNVTETPVLNRSLQVGSQSQRVTVEANAQTIQTQNATLGAVIGSREITSIPLSTRNYTQILDLSPGVVTNVATATRFGTGTQDVNVNGSDSASNNYSMDGADVTNFTNGVAGQQTTYGSIPVPNPDSIEQFKVQTAQYDASYGRNSGADVVVVTKGGTNNFHGDLWEFNRNNFFNANDYFNKITETEFNERNSPQTLKQNQFGFTFGGPIKKDKAFFFGSYQGTRQLNGAVPQGFSPGVNLPAINDYADVASGVCADVRCTTNVAAYRTYLGSVFGFGGPENQGTINGTGPAIAADGSNINPVSMAILQAPGLAGGLNQGFFVPGAPASCVAPCFISIEDPATANEDQFMINTDYDLSSKNTVSERFFYSHAPTVTPFGSSMPGNRSAQNFSNDVGNLKLTSILTNNLVNQAMFSFNRASAISSNGYTLTACGVGMTPGINNGAPCPLVSGALPAIGLLPGISVSGTGYSGYYGVGSFSTGGTVFTDASTVDNTFEGSDQLSWNHGSQSIRVGFDAERDQWVYVDPGEDLSGMTFPTFGDFLYGGEGTITGLGGTVARGLPMGTGVNIRETDFSSYFQDDVKVNSRLTVNAGVRWEYEGLPHGADGRLTNVWSSLLGSVDTGSFFNNNPQGTLAGFVVQSSYPEEPYGLVSPTGATGVVVSNNNSLLPDGAPLDVFSPRFGLAWQPFGSHLVVRAGYGWFHDHIYASLIAKQLEGNPPEVAPYDTTQLQFQTIASPFPVSYQGFGGCPATGGVCPALGWVPRSLTSPIRVISTVPNLRIPLVQQYNLDLQYQLSSGWLVSVGYVGSHGVALFDGGRSGNTDYLIAGAPNTPAGLFGEIPESALPYNDALNPAAEWIPTNNGPDPRAVSANQLDRVPYLGLSTENGLALMSTDGAEVYNSLQATIQHTFSHGFSFQAAYTWSKMITDISGGLATTGSGANEGGNLIQGTLASGYAGNAAQMYGLADFNRPQRLVVSYVYDVPYKGTSALRRGILGGWSVSGVTTVQDGEPFSVSDGRGGSIYGSTSTGGNSRAELEHPVDCNVLGNCKSAVPYATPGGVEARLNCYIAYVNAHCPGVTAATVAFAPSGSEPLIGGVPNPNPGPYTAGTCTTGTTGSYEFYNCGTIYGNSGVGVVMGPGQFNFDMALAKTLPITENTRLEFRAEAFNIWNHTQFNGPASTNLTSSSFGEITSTSVPPRIIQFGLKFYF